MLTCYYCQYQFKYKCKLVVHMMTHTGEKPHACVLCDYRANTPDSLRCHMRTHTGEKPYACGLCDYRAAMVGTLRGHMRLHTGEKPYACELCGYRSNQGSNMAQHMKRHAGERSHTCQLCDYRGYRRRDLVSHMRTHTREKAHACLLCDYTCSRAVSLAKHIMMTHTDMTPHACGLCKHRFKTAACLRDHMKTHIGNEALASRGLCIIPSTGDQVPRRTAAYFTALTYPVSKQTPTFELKAIAVQTMLTRFPKKEWTRVYTNSSATGARRNGGEGVGTIAAPFGTIASNFDGEVRAIVLALDMLLTIDFVRAVILCDSKAAIVSLCTSSPTDSCDVLKGRRLLDQLLATGVTVVLQWFPFRAGVRGDERADAQAKESSQMAMPDSPDSLQVDTSLIKSCQSDKAPQAHQQSAEAAALLNPSDQVPHDLPQQKTVHRISWRTSEYIYEMFASVPKKKN